jgi:SAM-dependent methyltransferase
MKRSPILNCPVCRGGSKIVDRVPTIHPQAAEEVDLCSCDSCGHWWHSPLPDQEELNLLYRSASPFVVSSGAKESYRQKDRPDPFHKYVLKRFKNASGNYLEIGAGGGGLLRRFRERGFSCYGVDPGQWVEDPSIVRTLEEVPGGMRFDVFVLQDVLEHVLDPIRLLRQLKDLAREGAVFFCSFPCKDSKPAQAYKGKWPMVRPYGHLHYYSFSSAEKMFSSAGLKIRDMRLERITPLSKTILTLNVRTLVYEIVKGGADQIFAEASVY